MAFVHGFAARGGGGLDGVQSDQRDWSPFVAHFTSYRAMEPVRTLHRANTDSGTARRTLAAADEASFDVFAQIVASATIRTSRPSETIAECVCFSECSLPGLLGHVERYGRFGFVFSKSMMFGAGARPCCYVDANHYQAVVTNSPVASQPRLAGLYNKYIPAGGAASPQDYTHEREWRLFDPVNIGAHVPEAVLVPTSAWIRPARQALEARSISVDLVLPLDTMFRWGV